MADSNTNPYLALLQQEAKPPGWAEILQHIGNLGFGLAGGFGQAAATGQPTMNAIGPGLMMGNQLNAQAAQQAEQQRMKRLEWQFRAQEHEDKRAEVLRKQKALEAYTNSPGFNVAPPPGPILGPQPTPGGYDTRVAGLEGGTKKGGMVFNELGSGAFGPYQFMPATWAAVRAQNPSLNLPADITQASREQHDAAHGAFKAGNAQGLQAGGFQPTPENLYLAHRFGLGGALSVLRADPDKPLHEVLPIDWQRQNPDMRGQTAGGFRRLATERVGGSSAPYVVRPDAKPTPYSLMPDDVPFSLSSGETTLPRPSTAQPTFTAPVMPQPTWEKPGDVMPVNPAGWFPPLAAPAQPPPVPGQPGQPGQPPAPGTPTPGGPNVVQAQATPGPNTPPMAPGGGAAPGSAPAPGSANPPPEFTPPARVPVPPEVSRHFKGLAAAGLITVGQAEKSIEDYGENLNKQVHETARAQHTARVEIWKQREQVAVEQRKIQAQVEAEQRAIAEAKRKREESREQEGEWVRDPATGVETLVAKKDLKPGMVRMDKPAAPPAPGTTAGDDHILSTGDPSSVEYRDAFNRQAREPKIVNGQAYVRDMTKVPPPTYGQVQPAPAGAPSQAGAPPADQTAIPGMTKVGEPNYTETQTKNYGFAARLQNSLPQLEAMLRDQDGNYSTKRLPSSSERMAMMNPNVPDSYLSDEAKEFRRLATDIVTGILRPESGAAINLSEYPQEVAKYIPQPGDSHKEIEAKLRAIKVVGRTIAEGSGRPLDKFGGVFNTSPGQPSAPATPSGGTFPAPPPAAIKALQMAPNQREDFDKMFGPGAAAKVLGR